jgi:ClpA/ClpB-like protein
MRIYPGTFTDDARTIMFHSQEHARRLGHTHTGGEHFLLALAAADVPVAAGWRRRRDARHPIPHPPVPRPRPVSTGPPAPRPPGLSQRPSTPGTPSTDASPKRRAAMTPVSAPSTSRSPSPP